jgi:hypothetical protein
MPMKEDEFELLSVEEMRRKYRLTVANRSAIHLDPARVPEPLRPLIPYAEIWGVKDDLIRDDLVQTAPPAAIKELKRIVEQYDDLLDEWLAGPDAGGPEFSEEYLVFSAMRMAADFA